VSADRIGERRRRLHRAARRLDPVPERLPYYIQLPPGPDGEKAPGWYMRDAELGAAPFYLGANAFTAELALVQRAEAQRGDRERQRRRAGAA
jgi:hypothetical protein